MFPISQATVFDWDNALFLWEPSVKHRTDRTKGKLFSLFYFITFTKTIAVFYLLKLI